MVIRSVRTGKFYRWGGRHLIVPNGVIQLFRNDEDTDNFSLNEKLSIAAYGRFKNDYFKIMPLTPVSINGCAEVHYTGKEYMVKLAFALKTRAKRGSFETDDIIFSSLRATDGQDSMYLLFYPRSPRYHADH